MPDYYIKIFEYYLILIGPSETAKFLILPTISNICYCVLKEVPRCNQGSGPQKTFFERFQNSLNRIF